PMDQAHASALLGAVARWQRRALRERRTRWVYGSDELYLLARRPLPGAEHYGDFPQIENGVGAVASLRARVSACLSGLPRVPGRRIGVVTGVSMGEEIMPALLDQLARATGAHFELIVAENSLFGRTTTTAGLLVSEDIRRALSGRADLDMALIPAECINDDGLFLDDATFEDVRRELPMPIHPSYDFADVLGGEGDRNVPVSLAGAAS
ncbi:MAG: DUF512 domain-containing protein, partial [Gemmatimonadaceae bacterium]